jgi:DNA-directed RNA polymerase specialized sigma subunit
MPDTKSKDIKLFNKWKETGDKKAMGELVNQLAPIIHSEVRKVSGTLPEAALVGEAKKWTIKAIKTYDPDRGVALSTHVMNYLPKIKRMNYQYQNSARLPENLQLQYSQFKGTISNLQEQLGREPTDDEIAKSMGWSKGTVVKFKGRLYEDLVESSTQRPIEVSQFNSNRFLMDHLMDQLDETEKYILLNSKEVSVTEMCAHLGINVSRYNYLKAKLRDKIMNIKREIGMY